MCVSLHTGASYDEAVKLQLVEGVFLFSLVWSVGATGDGDSRVKFDTFLRSLCMNSVPEQ